MWVHYGRVGRMVVMEEHRRKGSWTAKQRERIPLTSRCWRKRLRYHLGEPLGMEPAAGLVELAARRPARECLLGDRSLVHTRYFHRVPRCGQPRPTWRRAYTNPGIAQWAERHQATFMRMGTHSNPRLQPNPSCLR